MSDENKAEVRLGCAVTLGFVVFILLGLFGSFLIQKFLCSQDPSQCKDWPSYRERSR